VIHSSPCVCSCGHRCLVIKRDGEIVGTLLPTRASGRQRNAPWVMAVVVGGGARPSEGAEIMNVEIPPEAGRAFDAGEDFRPLLDWIMETNPDPAVVEHVRRLLPHLGET
jgi:hypothetical protein